MQYLNPRLDFKDTLHLPKSYLVFHVEVHQTKTRILIDTTVAVPTALRVAHDVRSNSIVRDTEQLVSYSL